MEEGIDEANNKARCLRKMQNVRSHFGEKKNESCAWCEEKSVESGWEKGETWKLGKESGELRNCIDKLSASNDKRRSNFFPLLYFLPSGVIFRIVKTIKDQRLWRWINKNPCVILSTILISSICFRPIKLNAMKQHWKTEIFSPPSSSPPFYYVSREIGSRKESNINPGGDEIGRTSLARDEAYLPKKNLFFIRSTLVERCKNLLLCVSLVENFKKCDKITRLSIEVLFQFENWRTSNKSG